MLRRLRLALAPAFVAACAAGALNAGAVGGVPGTAATFVFTGHGWGHGVGMSQYGALGYARAGYGYRRILAHYYPGTAFGHASTATLRVLLLEGAKRLVVRSDADFSVTDGAGTVHKLAAGTYPVGPALELPLGANGEPVALPGPLLFKPGRSPIGLAHLWRGAIQIDSAKGKLQAIDIVGLEDYVAGVVPDEMPHDWPREALKAQAVVARSYALSHLSSGSFDLYGDQRSQVYGGLEAESPGASAAVAATRGQVLTWRGKVANTPYFSTSGGRTASAAEVWGSAKAPPYLVSVPDPYDRLSPYHDWGPVGLTGKQVARLLQVPGPVTDLTAVRWPDGRVRTLVAETADGETDVKGTDARFALALRSTWFTVGVLSLTPPEQPVVYGSRTELTGVARALKGVVLEERPTASSQWEPSAPLSASAGGSFSAQVAPAATTQYRLTSGTVHSAPVRVPVAALVRASEAPGGGIEGSCQPASDGAPVELQLEDVSGGWATQATAALDATGRFATSDPLPTGTYRARCAPGNGTVAGTSDPLQVSG